MRKLQRATEWCQGSSEPGLWFRMADFKKLKVWRKAHALALNVDWAATKMRGPHRAALRSQINRAAESIPANIVEGREQRTDKAFIRYLRHAMASTSELEYHLTYARDIGAMRKSIANALLTDLEEVRKMLIGLINRLGGA